MKKIIFVITALCGWQLMLAQPDKKELEKANQMYKNSAFVDAIKIYESIANKGYVDQKMLQSLGDAYYYNAEYKKALTWYKQLFSGKYSMIEPEYYYRYAQTLRSAGNSEQADKYMKEFAELTDDKDSRVQMFEEHKDYKAEIEENSGRFELTPAAVNTPFSEYGGAFYDNDNIVFAAASKGREGEIDARTGDSYYNLYTTKRTKQRLNDTKTLFSPELTSMFNESTTAFTKDGNTVYFTRNNYINSKIGMNNKKSILLKIFKATKDANGKWGNVTELPFNSNNYNVAHPALSPEEDYLYFSSDMNGTLGQSDIFRVEIREGGTYGVPENLGSAVNTPGRESFPYVDKDNILYFSSDGFPGVGGMDIFAIKMYSDGTFSKLMNIGKPGNSMYDDFCYVVDSQSRVGFLSSNRPGGKGKDDIYGFIDNDPLKFDCEKSLTGVVKDAETKQPLSEVALTLSNKAMEAASKIKSRKDGSFTFKLNYKMCKDPYFYIRGQKERYEVNEVKVNNEEGEVKYEFYLKPRQVAVQKNTDLAKVFEIKEIYFDLGKYNIREDAALELSKIAEVMKENPTMKIDIRAHTDSRGSDASNLKLSENRAKATLEWIAKQGVDRKRLSAKGYGETRLVNGCTNGVPCTEEEHQANRRSEFIVTNI
jgi:ompA/motB domain protein